VNSITVNDSATVEYKYDDDGALTTAGDFTLTRNEATGALEGTALGDVSTVITYSDFGKMDSYTAKHLDTEYFKTRYARDKLGRITQKTETIQGETSTFVYEYDVVGRLDKVYKNMVKIKDFKYDQNGNRLTANDSQLALFAIYDDQDRLLYEPASDTTYTYSAHGDLETKTDSEGTTSYNYDELGNLISVTLPRGAVIDYVVDGRNRRVAKKVDGVIATKWIYGDQLNPVAEIDTDGTETIFVYGSKINIPDYMIRGEQKYSIISDHLGSMRMIIDELGNVVFKRNYDAFGKITGTFSALGFKAPVFGFAGGIYDEYTKLVRFGTRDLDPAIGRWTNKDYILFNGGTANLYEYANNNPVNYVDLNGLDWRRFRDRVLNNFTLTNDVFLGGPLKHIKTGLGILVAGKVAEACGTLTTGQAVKSILFPAGMKGLGYVRGVATLGAAGTIGAALATTIIKGVLVYGVFEFGVLTGSIIEAGINEIIAE